MNREQEAFNQIAQTLARHFDNLYYIEIESGRYFEYVPSKLFEGMNLPSQGGNFFLEATNNISKYVHPDDQNLIVRLLEKDSMLSRLQNNNHFSLAFRMINHGRIIHMRHIEIMCEDQKHIMCCLENIDEEIRQKEEQDKNLQSAERMARLDLLTGIRNKNAFSEYTDTLNSLIRAGEKSLKFAVIMCDVNDLKKINDTRGHSFGDEAIRRASRMICDIFDHSPVFRIGGDEFVIVVDGSDYELRDYLLEKLRQESIANKKLRSGPVVASGIAVYEQQADSDFEDVFQRADQQMYENKKVLKSMQIIDYFLGMDKNDTPISPERKRLLDGMFGAIYTIVGEGYVFLNDMRYDFSRWALPLVDDFGMHSEYMYHADRVWQEHIHPDDIELYREAVDDVLSCNAEMKALHYRARRADGTYAVCYTRGFVLTDKDGIPEYFGGIILTQ